MTTDRNDTAVMPDFIQPGAVIEWRTWTGEYARATVTFVDRFRVSTDKPGIYWEATCFSSLSESLRRTEGLRPAA
jgi:hypothetical protein